MESRFLANFVACMSLLAIAGPLEQCREHLVEKYASILSSL